MKVLIIHPLSVKKNWKSDGIATYCNSLVKMFEGDTDMTVMSPSNISVVKCKLLKNFFKYSELKRVIDEFAPDVVHINGYTSLMSAQAFWALRNSAVKIVYTAHWHPFEYLAHPLMGKFFFNVFMKPFVKKYASIVTTINSEDTAFFRRIHSHVVQIPHSIPLESLSTDVAAERDPRMILISFSIIFSLYASMVHIGRVIFYANIGIIIVISCILKLKSNDMLDLGIKFTLVFYALFYLMHTTILNPVQYLHFFPYRAF